MRVFEVKGHKHPFTPKLNAYVHFIEYNLQTALLIELLSHYLILKGFIRVNTRAPISIAHHLTSHGTVTFPPCANFF